MARTILMASAAFLSIGLVARGDVVLYDGSLNTTPDAQGWTFINAGGSQSLAGGVTTLSTTASNSVQAGYFSTNPLTGGVMAGMPTLDASTGYTIQFDVKIDSESHSRADRAGFSLIALGSDHRGIELGFWTDQVWAQSDNPLFTHAEGAAFDTTAGIVRYQLAVLGNTYQLFAGDVALLTGSLRDYSSFGLPYTLTNFLFLGDDTTSASAQAELARIAVLSRAVPEPSTFVLGSLALLIAAGRKGVRYLFHSDEKGT